MGCFGFQPKGCWLVIISMALPAYLLPLHTIYPCWFRTRFINIPHWLRTPIFEATFDYARRDEPRVAFVQYAVCANAASADSLPVHCFHNWRQGWIVAARDLCFGGVSGPLSCCIKQSCNIKMGVTSSNRARREEHMTAVASQSMITLRIALGCVCQWRSLLKIVCQRRLV